jgi:hypothetical protein
MKMDIINDQQAKVKTPVSVAAVYPACSVQCRRRVSSSLLYLPTSTLQNAQKSMAGSSTTAASSSSANLASTALM